MNHFIMAMKTLLLNAQYFNKNYEFDSGGNLSIDIKDENSGLNTILSTNFKQQ